MREILFRGKSVADNQWVYGWYAQAAGWDNSAVIRDITDLMGRMVEVIADTVGQYTGLNDKNGEMIFEGDIIDMSGARWDAFGPAGHDSPITIVDWSESHCGFDPFANYDCDCWVYISADRCEVIGNIHDNPEKAKEGKEDGK